MTYEEFEADVIPAVLRIWPANRKIHEQAMAIYEAFERANVHDLCEALVAHFKRDLTRYPDWKKVRELLKDLTAAESAAPYWSWSDELNLWHFLRQKLNHFRAGMCDQKWIDEEWVIGNWFRKNPANAQRDKARDQLKKQIDAANERMGRQLKYPWMEFGELVTA